MDAPTGEQPMDVLGATNTLHRVSTEHLLPHRPAVTCVFPSARAREPFYATFSFVSRCHAASVCGSRPRATRIRVRMCAYARVRAVRASVHLPPPPHPFVHPDDDGGGGGDARELRALTRRVCFIRDFSNPLLRFFARVSPPPSSSSLPLFYSPVSHLCFPFLRLSHRFARNSARTFPSPVVLVADDTPSRTFAHFSTFIARAAGLQRNMRAREPNERAPVTVRVYRFFVYAGMLIEKYQSGRDSLAFSGKR